MKCSLNLATTNSTGVRKWSDGFSLSCVKNTISSTLLSIQRDTVSQWIELNAWHSFMGIRTIYFLCSTVLFHTSHTIYCSSMTTKVPLDSNTSFLVTSFVTPISINLFLVLVPHSCPENCGNPLLLSTILIYHLKKKDFFYLATIWSFEFPPNGEFLSCCSHADLDQ